MSHNLLIASLAPDKSSFTVSEGKTLTISKIVSGNGIDFMLYPSLTLTVKSLDGNSTYLNRSLLTYISPDYRNTRVVECEEQFNVGDGIKVTISSQGRNIDFNISVGYYVE